MSEIGTIRKRSPVRDEVVKRERKGLYYLGSTILYLVFLFLLACGLSGEWK